MGMFKLTKSSLNIKETMRRVEDFMTIVKFYNEDHLTLEQIGDLYNLSIVQVHRILKANGVKTNNRKGRNR